MEYLRQPLALRGLNLCSRIVMPPMMTGKASADGKAGEDLADYYRARAEGGKIGLIIVEFSYISQEGKAGKGQLSVSGDDDIPGLKLIADAIHVSGTKAILQINHAGSTTSQEVTGVPPAAPSAVLHPRAKPDSPLPRVLSREDIKGIVSDFAAAACRAEKAGFDGVELHAAHGYLLNQFYSPITNRRTDEYGSQSIENRLRIHSEVFAAVKKAVSKRFIVGTRLGGCDYISGGSTLEDCIGASRLLESFGTDFLDITGGLRGYTVPGRSEPGYFRDMTDKIKEFSSVPVILTGGITNPEDAERLLSEGAADLIGIGRALLAEAKWADKALA